MSCVCLNSALCAKRPETCEPSGGEFKWRHDDASEGVENSPNQNGDDESSHGECRLTPELSDAGGQARPNWQLTWPARIRSSDFVSQLVLIGRCRLKH